jgi:hypothetical protein
MSCSGMGPTVLSGPYDHGYTLKERFPSHLFHSQSFRIPNTPMTHRNNVASHSPQPNRRRSELKYAKGHQQERKALAALKARLVSIHRRVSFRDEVCHHLLSNPQACTSRRSCLFYPTPKRSTSFENKRQGASRSNCIGSYLRKHQRHYMAPPCSRWCPRLRDVRYEPGRHPGDSQPPELARY